MEEGTEKELQVSVLQFLADYGHLENIEKECSLYVSSIDKPTNTTVYKFRLLIDTFQLIQTNTILGNILIHQPGKGWSLFLDVLFITIQEMKWLPSLSSKTQLLMLLRLTALPDFSPYHLNHISELPSLSEEPRFISCTGVVCSMTIIEKYTESASFHCSNSKCISTHLIRYHTTGSSESITLRNDLSCYQCGNLLVEDMTHRSLADKCTVIVVPSSALKSFCSSIRYQGFTVVLRDDLCKMVEMGSEYTIIGVPINNTHSINGRIIVNTIIEANNIYQVNPVLHLSDHNKLSSHIKDIYDACQYSSWTFSATLAYSFGANIIPPGLFHRLKLLILLSIISANSSNTRDKVIDIMIIGNELNYVNQLLSYTANIYCQRCITFVNGLTLYNTVRKDEGTQWIDASSLLLAKGGICLMGDITKWKKDDKEHFQHILHTGTVNIKTTNSKHLSTGMSLMESPLQCTLWTTCDCHVTNSYLDNGKHLHDKIGLNKVLIDHLGVVLVTDPPTHSNEDFVTQVLTQHTLQSKTANQTSSVSLLTTQDFKEIISLSSKLDITLNPSAHELLKGYYLTSRRVRGTDMPLTALDIIISLTISHAQLNLRSQAVEDDAVLAILLYEETLIYKYDLYLMGYSTLYVQPLPHFKDANIATYIGREFDANMKQFHKQIYHFNHSSSSIVIREE